MGAWGWWLDKLKCVWKMTCVLFDRQWLDDDFLGAVFEAFLKLCYW